MKYNSVNFVLTWKIGLTDVGYTDPDAKFVSWTRGPTWIGLVSGNRYQLWFYLSWEW